MQVFAAEDPSDYVSLHSYPSTYYYRDENGITHQGDSARLSG